VLGFLLGGSGGDNKTPTPPPAQKGALTARGGLGDVDFKAPSDFKRLSSVPAVPGLALTDASAMAPGGEDGGTAIVSGVAKADAYNPTLLPAGFLKKLGDQPKADAVGLAGGLQAYRYSGLKPDGFDRSVTVYAAPTSAGVATLACLAPSDASDAFASTCDQVANTLSDSGGKPIALGPSRSYGRALSKVLGRLAKQDKAARAALAASKTPTAQARRAAALKRAFAHAGQSLAKLKALPADALVNAQFVAALKSTGKAYGKLGEAARRNDAGGYGRASAAVNAGRAQLGKALASLKAAGYDVSGS
jgi:hypothetical protein